MTNLKNGKTVDKPIYNHITGELDPYEEVPPTPIVIFEGLHPMHDDRVNEALDLTVYLDITARSMPFHTDHTRTGQDGTSFTRVLTCRCAAFPLTGRRQVCVEGAA